MTLKTAAMGVQRKRVVGVLDQQSGHCPIVERANKGRLIGRKRQLAAGNGVDNRPEEDDRRFQVSLNAFHRRKDIDFSARSDS